MNSESQVQGSESSIQGPEPAVGTSRPGVRGRESTGQGRGCKVQGRVGRTLAFCLLPLAFLLTACTPATALSEAQQAVQSRLSQAQQALQARASSAQQAVQSRLPGASSPAASAIGPDQAAVQLVVVRGDLEQEQAVASHDSSVMKDTSTDAYYQQAVNQNQQLLDSGVTHIRLVNLEWGAVTVNGTSAKADNYETWSTTYTDGSTEQTREHNIYALTKENGVWKIQADDQPGSSGAAQPRPSNGQGGGAPSAGASSGGSIGGATGSPPGAGSLAIAAPAGSPEAVIQQVVLKGNQEQERAIASHDSSVMKDTSTDAYYQDLAQTNQDMLDSGVTAIKLVKIEWGATSVTGSKARATTYETWSTNYSDGSVTQSRDRNDYTLVQQNGAWKIQADDHPDSDLEPAPGGTPPASPGASPSPQVPPAARVPRGRGVSSNWAGYTASDGKFTGVSGSWTVPQLPTAAGSLGADAAWVGIGGENSRDLIQAGTEETVLSSGRVQYDAWIEMLPQYSHPIPLAVHPGDSVTVSINQQAGRNWLISFKNNTSGATYQRTVTYDSSLTSAEWIEEAPSGRGGILPLDNFGSVSFKEASAVKNGQTVNLVQAGAQPITMINRSDQPLVTPSTITNDGSGFTLTRTNNAPSTFRRGIP